MYIMSKCQRCGKDYTHRQSLHKHRRNCTGESKSDAYKELSAMFGNPDPDKKIRVMSGLEPSVKKKKPVGNGLSEGENESKSVVSLGQLRTQASSSKGRETVKKLIDGLLDEINENESLKEKVLPILKQLREAALEDGKKASDDEELSENIYDLIRETVEHLTKNLRENLHKLLFDINFGYFDEKIRKFIKSFLEGKEEAETVTDLLGNDINSTKVKMVVNEIGRVQRKVKEVLQRLSNIHDSDVIKTLESLRMREQISDDEFNRMVLADNDLSSFAKAMKGSGLWLGRK